MGKLFKLADITALYQHCNYYYYYTEQSKQIFFLKRIPLRSPLTTRYFYYYSTQHFTLSNTAKVFSYHCYAEIAHSAQWVSQ